jgi:hypothetical protein
VRLRRGCVRLPRMRLREVRLQKMVRLLGDVRLHMLVRRVLVVKERVRLQWVKQLVGRRVARLVRRRLLRVVWREVLNGHWMVMLRCSKLLWRRVGSVRMRKLRRKGGGEGVGGVPLLIRAGTVGHLGSEDSEKS